MTSKGWLDRQIQRAREDIREWPTWMKKEAGIGGKQSEGDSNPSTLASRQPNSKSQKSTGK